MLSLERTKEILNDPSLSDMDVEQIRNAFRSLAEIMFEQRKLLEKPK
jgi:hypothetical protein